MQTIITKLAIFAINLQLFADAGTLVNATGAYVNAYTGQTTAFDDAHSLSVELKTFYDTELLENARIEMYYAQFGKKQRLPRNHGKTVEWRKWNTFARADELQEAVIPTGQKFGATSLTGAIKQYGTYTAVSDLLELHAYDPVILGATEEMGASMAETQEALIRDALYANPNVFYCPNIVRATGAEYDTPDEAIDLKSDATYLSMLTPDVVAKVVTIMKKNRVPTINGKYYAVIHPSVAYNLRKTEAWIESHKYAAVEQIFNGEIGELHGMRFIEDTFAPVFSGADLASNSRTLKINNADGYSGAITSVAFDGGTVAASALVGRKISINGVVATVTANTTSAITFASTNFGSIANDTDIYPGEGGAAGVAVYATYVFGKEAFGIIDPDGGNAAMIVKNKGEVGGPLEQFSTIGYKLETNGATMLYPERCLRIMSSSDFASVDEAN